MKRALLAVPLLVAGLLGVGPSGDRPAKKATPTPMPTPELETSEAAEPTPTPEPPRFLAALESSQGDGGDRLGLFADGTVSWTVRWKTRRVTRRIVLSREELEIVRRVLGEALAATDQEVPQGGVLTPGSERLMKLEIAEVEGPPRTFLFDDTTSLPLAAGRARGALEDLRNRFDSRTPVGDPGWDPAEVTVGDRLRRKADGLWFVVVRDDTFERNLELRSENGSFVLWTARGSIPKTFHDPAFPSPDPPPPPAEVHH